MNQQHAGKQTSHTLVKWLFLLYLLFVVYGSLVPMQYVDRSLDEAIEAFKNVPFLALGIDSLADWVANLLLFIPLTLLASLLVNTGERMAGRALVAVLLASFAILLAIGIEFTQLFFPQRTVSQNDIFAESVGGLIGIGFHWVFGTRIQIWLDGFWRHEHQQDRVIRLLHAYLIVLFVFSVLPLDLTLSPVELFHKWKEGRIILVPLTGLKDNWSEGLYEVLTDILVWLPAGLLWAMQAGSSLRRVFFRVIIAVSVIEILQLFVYSRVTNINQVWLAGIGGLAGWAFARGGGKGMPAIVNLLERHWRSLWLAWFVLVVGIFWFPFNFDLDGMTWSSATVAFTRLPLTTYYFASEFHATIELLRKVGFFLPGGLLLGFAACRPNTRLHRSAAMPWVLTLLPALGVEIGQLALPGKVADLTDALLESAGGLLGYLIAYWIDASTPTRPSQLGAGAVPRDSVSTPRLKAPRPPMRWIDGYKAHLAYVVVLSVMMSFLFSMPGAPYSLRALVGPGLTGWVSMLGLSLTAYLMANGVFLLFPARRRRWFLAFPVFLVVHGMLAWGLLRVSAPAKSLDDIVGSPVLDWSWEWEALLRYLALHMVLMLQVLGAVLCVRTILKPATLADFAFWATISMLLAWPLYLVVVEWAATDNLTELMASDASFYCACALAGALFLTCLVASALSAAPYAPQQAVTLVWLALVAAMGASLLYWLGAQHTIVKYGRAFSAFQFLLSTDREHYAQGVSLILRYLVALAAVCGGLAALQLPSWRRFCCSVVSSSPTEHA